MTTTNYLIVKRNGQTISGQGEDWESAGAKMRAVAMDDFHDAGPDSGCRFFLANEKISLREFPRHVVIDEFDPEKPAARKMTREAAIDEYLEVVVDCHMDDVRSFITDVLMNGLDGKPIRDLTNAELVEEFSNAIGEDIEIVS